MNIVKLKTQLKHDIREVIGGYEAKYKFPIVMIDAVLTDIISEIRTLELEDIALEGAENGKITRTEGNAERHEEGQAG